MSRAQVTVIGNVGRVDDLRFAKNGKAMVKISVACTDRVKEQDGTWVDGDTTWYDVTAFGIIAEAISDNINKGQQVIVIGNLKRSEWIDKEDQTRVSFEVLADHIGVVPFRKQNRGGGGRSDGRRAVRQDQTDAPF